MVRVHVEEVETEMRRTPARSSEKPVRASPAACREAPTGYTKSMKTAISLPDPLFHAADRLAKRAQKSRSQLYADALREYLTRHAPDEVTEAMNQVVDAIGPVQPDPFQARAAKRALEHTEW